MIVDTLIIVPLLKNDRIPSPGGFGYMYRFIQSLMNALRCTYFFFIYSRQVPKVEARCGYVPRLGILTIDFRWCN